ncbi:MAG: hypothetical protein WCK20_07065, partial [Thermoleophilia bacterium]
MAASNRPKIFYRSLAASTLVSAALIAGSAVASAQGLTAEGTPPRISQAAGVVPQPLPNVRALVSSDAGCVAYAEYMARQLLWSIDNPRVSRSTVARVITRIKKVSAPCNKLLFHNGTRAHPDAGILTGKGFSFKSGTCTGTKPCDGGDGGLLLGSGGNGFNGGSGGDAGWYSGRAGNGSNAVVAGQD